MELLGSMDLIILGWECQRFSTAGFGKGLNDTKSGLFTEGMIDHLGSIHLSYAWLCN
jgi:site-specific DNA-cytosine methylase